MKKVLFVIDSLQVGGAEKSILEITSRLKDFTPIVCILFSTNADLLVEFQKRTIKIVQLDLSGINWLYEGRKKLKSIIKEHRPVLVHATLFNSELLTRITLDTNGPILVNSFVNDSYVNERYLRQTKFENFKLDIYKFIDRLTSKRVHHFISITDAVAKSNARILNIPADKITTIYRGRNIQTYEVNQPSINSKPFIYLTVARLVKRKGFYELLDAVKILSMKAYSFKILIAGEGRDRKLFEGLVVKNNMQDKVNFLGSRNDVQELLKKAHCFVFPSHYEGQGGALVEAMIAGKPVIVTKIPVFEEQIKDNKTGVFFNLFDKNDLADKMYWVYQNYESAKKMGDTARKTAEERFDVEIIARKYEILYHKLLAEK
jgi:glycosyltransferase involved in cell wall biosynthesis